MKLKTMIGIASLLFTGLIHARAVAQVTATHETMVISDMTKTPQIYRYSNSVTDFDIEMRGEVEITDDDSDIKGMSDDGYLEINKTVFGSRRTVVIKSMGGNTLKREYYENRSKKDWEPAGKAWLAEILPGIVRNSAIGAKSRVERFYKKGKTDAVLSEIDQIESDYARAIYAGLLMKQPVPVSDYPRIVSAVTQKLNSDHYMAEFLRKNVDKFMQNKEAMAAFFTATHNLNSDHYKTVVIKEAPRSQAASPENIKVILAATAKMESDHYKSEVLTAVIRQNDLSEPVITDVIEAVSQIRSDHYQTMVLIRAMDKPGLTSRSHQKVIEAVKNIQSDHYVAEVIKHLQKNKLSDELISMELDIMGSIESDHYKSEVLGKLMRRQDLNEPQFSKLIAVTGQLGSDHYKAVLLKDMLDLPNVSNAAVLSIIDATKKINSDHYISEVLLTASPKVRAGNQQMKDAYRQAAREIDSPSTYGSVLKAVD